MYDKITIRKDFLPKYLLWFEIMYICVVQNLIWIGFKTTITIICDIVNCFLILFLIKYFRRVKVSYQVNKIFYSCYGMFFVVGTFSAMVNGLVPVLWVWSIRNFGRFFIVFVSATVFFSLDDYYLFKKLLFLLSHLNFILCLFQFGVIGNKGDYIGGLFGIQAGVANTWMNTFLVIVAVVYISEWLCGKEKMWKVMMVLSEGLSIAVIAELKFYFIELAIVILWTIVVVKKTNLVLKRIMGVTCFSLVALLITIPILYSMFPTFNDFFNIRKIIEIAGKSYTGTGDLSRTKAIVEIIDKLFDKDVLKSVIGVGLGNGEYSTNNEIFQSSFFKTYQAYRYHWFTDAFVMVETGLIGVGLYGLSFIALLFKAMKKYKAGKLNKGCHLNVILLAPLSLLLCIYNISLNTEITYILYIALAFGCLYKESK